MHTTAGKEQELLDFLKRLYENDLPFNRLIGLKIKSISLEKVKTEFSMHADLIGNPVQKTLHGGVISSVLDATGGLVATAGIIQRMHRDPVDSVLNQFSKVGTIDLRVDYLRPGRGGGGGFFGPGANTSRPGGKVGGRGWLLQKGEIP